MLVAPPPPKEANLQTHYEELLRVIAEVGKDIKPAYTNNKVSADRLKRSEKACLVRLQHTFHHTSNFTSQQT